MICKLYDKLPVVLRCYNITRISKLSCNQDELKSRLRDIDTGNSLNIGYHHKTKCIQNTILIPVKPVEVGLDGGVEVVPDCYL